MRTLRLSSLVLLAALAAGCAHHAASFQGPLDEAATAAKAGSSDARTLALAGFRAWLVDGDLDRAHALLTQAVQKDAHDPYALYGGLLLARHDGHPEKVLAYAFDLCEHNPTHPLCTPAARAAGELVGTATSLDQTFVTRATRILSLGAQGDAAFLLRNALASIHREKPDLAALSPLLSDAGAPTAWTLVGPLSPFHLLSFDDAPKVLATGSLEGPFQGPFGDVTPRTLTFPGGQLSLAGEPPNGDFYLAAVDFTVPEGGRYVVRTVTADSIKAFIDGQKLFERRAFERSLSTVNAKGVELSQGKHRLLLQLNKPDRGTYLMATVERADGKPSNLHFTPATGKAPRLGEVEPAEVDNVYPEAQDLERALEGEVGSALARYIAAEDGMGRNPDGAQALAEALTGLTNSPAVSQLKASIELRDRSVPQKVSRGRATRDLEAALAKDPKNVFALLAEADLALDDGRIPEAEALTQRAKAALTPVGPLVWLEAARVQLALGLDARADDLAIQALQTLPTLCDAAELRYDLADKHDAVSKSDTLLKALEGCPRWTERALLHAKARGDAEGALALAEGRAALHPEDLRTALDVTALLVGQRHYEEALAPLTARWKDWPRNPLLPKRMGDVLALAGKFKEALAARQASLALDGGDLSLRRQVARETTGKELLQDLAVDGMTAIRAYQAKAPHEDAASTLVLDAAATQVYADGSQVDRIHTITKVLDQSAVSDVAEVNLPAGAQVLALRTIKPDGRVLQPEQIENKSTISMPGVEPGDFVEEEFLLAHPARSPAVPGFSASNFYFQVANTPDHWATYVVRAPKGSQMGVDGHNLEAPPVKTEGDQEVFRHEVRDSPPLIAEPDSPPMINEYVPFVAVGGGAQGQDGMVAYYADTALGQAQVTYEVERFAQKATEGKTGLEAVRALDAAVNAQLTGEDAGFSSNAAASVAQSRGSRLLLLQAGLKAIGIPARLVAVRTYSVDPAKYVYPTGSLLPYLCIRAELPNGDFVWLDTLVRFSPFNQLPEQAANGREAWVLPTPTQPLEHLKTPDNAAKPGKDVALTVALSPEGVLTGSGVETYTGFEAAAITNALSSLSPSQRDQALQSALSRYFGGANLSSVKVEMEEKVGAPVKVQYAFTAPNFARHEGDKLVLGSLTFPAYLGRRFVEVGARTIPLFIDGTEQTHTHVTLALPPGMRIQNPLGPAAIKSAYGAYSRTEDQDGQKLEVKESYLLPMNRIPVKDYDAFAQFAGEVDLIQSREIVLGK